MKVRDYAYLRSRDSFVKHMFQKHLIFPSVVSRRALEYKTNKSLKKRLEEIIGFTGDENDYVVFSDLECLKYLHENGCPWDEGTCLGAAHGRLDCLKYAREKGCPWDEVTCSAAALHGQLECLKYAHENGCPWDEKTCSLAAENGQLECLKYAHENGCPGSAEYARKYC